MMQIKISLPEASTRRFKKIQKDLDCSTGEVISQALRLLEWALINPVVYDKDGKEIKFFLE